MKSVLLLTAGLVVGWLSGAAVADSMARQQVDYEWARMLENGMVGPGTTERPGASAAVSRLQIRMGA